jgi:hypothetical protein
MSTVTGSSANILDRVRKLIPSRWFAWVAPFRDALLGGLSDIASWYYSMIVYARAQTRIATAYGIWLDLIAYDYLGRFLVRTGASDSGFRARILATILQERVTRKGMIAAVTALTGTAPIIFEPWNTSDTGAYSNTARGKLYGQMGYGVGQGGYGSMILPSQIFMKIHRGSGSGVPNVGGYANKAAGITTIGGYGVGSLEYVGLTSEQWGITDAMIYDVINKTKPTGSTVWVQFY